MQQTPVPIEDKVVAALRELAGAVGETAEKLWPMAVKATWAEGIAGMAGCLLAATFLGIAALVAWRTKPESPDGRLSRYFVLGFAAIGAFSFLVCGTFVNLSDILAPEGRTLFKLLGK